MADFLQVTLGLNFFQATVRAAVPLIFATLGCLYAERSGIINVSAEGMMLVGAFFATAAAVTFDSLWMGVLASILVGALLGLLLGYLSVTLAANQIVVGITLNLIALGTTSFLVRLWFPLTGGDADVCRQARTAVCDKFLQAAVNIDGRANGAHWIIVVGNWRAENGHHIVAYVFVDPSTIGLDDPVNGLEIAIKQTVRAFGTKLACQRRIVRDISK